jgi:hypothetical protein
MKRILFVSTLALSTMLFSCKSDKTGTDETTTVATDSSTSMNVTDAGAAVTTQALTDLTSMKIDRMSHDFGKIPETSPVETSFVITNTGDKPLLITNAVGSCGCTVPDYPKDPIAPGESRDMKVSFNPSGKVGVNTKNVTITANTDPATTTIDIKSEVYAAK